MKYPVIFSKSSDRDIVNIYEYISDNLKNPVSAAKITKNIVNKCKSLSLFPKASRVRQKIDGVEYRYAHANSYTIIYSVDDSEKCVKIHSVTYSSRNFKKKD